MISRLMPDGLELAARFIGPVHLEQGHGQRESRAQNQAGVEFEGSAELIDGYIVSILLQSVALAQVRFRRVRWPGAGLACGEADQDKRNQHQDQWPRASSSHGERTEISHRITHYSRESRENWMDKDSLV